MAGRAGAISWANGWDGGAAQAQGGAGAELAGGAAARGGLRGAERAFGKDKGARSGPLFRCFAGGYKVDGAGRICFVASRRGTAGTLRAGGGRLYAFHRAEPAIRGYGNPA